jgi:hypothetical protein
MSACATSAADGEGNAFGGSQASGGSTSGGATASGGTSSSTGGTTAGGNSNTNGGNSATAGTANGSGGSPNDIAVYTDANSLTSLAWKGNGTFSEISSGAYEGNKAYKYDYNVVSYWDGFFLNLSHPLDVTAATELRYAYKGLTSPIFVFIRLHSGATACAANCDFENPNPAADWQTVTIPMSALASGAAKDGVDLTNVTAIEFGFSGSSDGTGSGTLYIDDIVFGG